MSVVKLIFVLHLFFPDMVFNGQFVRGGVFFGVFYGPRLLCTLSRAALTI